MDSKPIGVLAVDAPVLHATVSCAELRHLFLDDPRLSGVLLTDATGIALVDRAVFDAFTARDDLAALEARPATDVADHDPLVLDHDLDLLDAATHVLERSRDSQYEDVVVRGPGDKMALVPVSRMLGELTQLYRHQARHDVLTGLANRTLVLERLAGMLSQAQRQGGLVATLFVDLDNFKSVNDTHGHQAGDRLLMHVAQRLRDAARPHDLVGRLGGDEFVVAAAVPSMDELPRLGSRILDALDAPFPIDGGPAVRVRASVGVAADDGQRPADEVLRLADDAMYVAKRSPGSRVAFAHRLPTGRHAASMAEDERLAGMLREGIENDSLRLAYQPVVSLETGLLQRVEVLARMPLPSGELVPPERFVAVAEQSDLIDRLGDWVLERSLRQLKSWDELLGSAAPRAIGINLSPRQCLDPRLDGTIGRLLESTSTDPDRVWLEIPETIATINDPAMLRTLTTLRRLGVHVSIDDFGVGDATLGRIAELPVDELKIDRSLISGFLGERAQRQVVRMIIGLGRDLGISVVAEGVETSDQVRLLTILRCPAAQGYRFGHPMWADDLRGHLTELAS